MPVKITTKRGSEIGSLPNFARSVKLIYIGNSLGETILVNSRDSNALFECFYSDTTTLSLTALYEINNVVNVFVDPNDQFNSFIKNVDYTYAEDSNEIIWLDNPIKPPELEVSLLTSGGSGLNLINYNYKIVAFGVDGTTTTTLPSNIATIPATSAPSQSHKFYWTKVAHAAGYIIYDSTANKRITIINNPNTTTYTRTTNAGTSDTIPTVSTAFRKPDADITQIYCDYNYIVFDNDINNFTTLNQVSKKYGIGSELTNMARIAFQQFNVPEIYAISPVENTNQSYIDAIDKIRNLEDVQYIIPLRDSEAVCDYAVTHAKNQSTEDEQKERFAVIHIPGTVTTVGDEATTGTIRYRLKSFNDEKRAIIVVPNGNSVYMNEFQEVDGTFTENKLVANYFLSGALAAAIVTSDDVATPVINRELSGFNFGPNGAQWVDSVEKNKIEESGGTYVYSKNGKLVVYNDNTNDVTQTENFERSIVSAEDEMRRRLRNSHSQYLGRKITQGLRSAIYSTTSSVLKQMVSDLLIDAFNEGSLEVNQDDTIKTKISVVFRYSPVYPLKELEFIYSFDL